MLTWIPRRSPALTSPLHPARRACNLVAPRRSRILTGTPLVSADEGIATKSRLKTEERADDPRNNQEDYVDVKHLVGNAGTCATSALEGRRPNEYGEMARTKDMQDAEHSEAEDLSGAFEGISKDQALQVRLMPLFTVTLPRPQLPRGLPTRTPARANTSADRSC